MNNRALTELFRHDDHLPAVDWTLVSGAAVTSTQAP
jgi:hypothetical protein